MMEPRIDFTEMSPDAFRAMLSLEKHLDGCSVDRSLLQLMRLHVSQLNGCAVCIDMHWKDARAAGETEQRLYGLPAWRESPYYTERERAALAWAEEVTRVASRRVPDGVYEQVRAVFSEEEVVDLTWAVAAINSWNRVNVALRTRAGEYQPMAH